MRDHSKASSQSSASAGSSRARPDCKIRCNPLDLFPLADRGEQEKLVVFGLCVPRKQADVVWQKVQYLWPFHGRRPFRQLAYFHSAGTLLTRCTEARLGQYERIVPCMSRLAELGGDWTWDEIAAIVGRKTAAMVGIYSSPAVEGVAAIDVHVANWLRARLGDLVPDHGTPAGYSVCERLFLEEAARMGLKPWELDKMIWTSAAKFKRSACHTPTKT